MPTPLIKKYAQQSGKTVAEVDAYWNEAKEQAKSKFKEDSPQFWAYVNGIVKKRCKINEGLSLKEYLSEGWRAEEAIKEHSTKLSPEESEKVKSIIRSHPAAEETRQWYNGVDGEEIDLKDFFKRPKAIISGGHAHRRVCLVPINELGHAQTSVQKNYLLKVLEKNKEVKDENLPEVVYSVDLTSGGNHGDLCILDGHHHLTLYKMAGRKYAKVNLVIATKTGNDKFQYKTPHVDADGRFVPPKSQHQREADKLANSSN